MDYKQQKTETMIKISKRNYFEKGLKSFIALFKFLILPSLL